jgi:hypothetical protein
MQKDSWNLIDFDQNFHHVETLQLIEPIKIPFNNPYFCNPLMIFQKLRIIVLSIIQTFYGSFYYIFTLYPPFIV